MQLLTGLAIDDFHSLHQILLGEGADNHAVSRLNLAEGEDAGGAVIGDGDDIAITALRCTYLIEHIQRGVDIASGFQPGDRQILAGEGPHADLQVTELAILKGGTVGGELEHQGHAGIEINLVLGAIIQQVGKLLLSVGGVFISTAEDHAAGGAFAVDLLQQTGGIHHGDLAVVGNAIGGRAVLGIGGAYIGTGQNHITDFLEGGILFPGGGIVAVCRGAGGGALDGVIHPIAREGEAGGIGGTDSDLIGAVIQIAHADDGHTVASGEALCSGRRGGAGGHPGVHSIDAHILAGVLVLQHHIDGAGACAHIRIHIHTGAGEGEGHTAAGGGGGAAGIGEAVIGGIIAIIMAAIAGHGVVIGVLIQLLGCGLTVGGGPGAGGGAKAAVIIHGGRGIDLEGVGAAGGVGQGDGVCSQQGGGGCVGDLVVHHADGAIVGGSAFQVVFAVGIAGTVIYGDRQTEVNDQISWREGGGGDFCLRICAGAQGAVAVGAAVAVAEGDGVGDGGIQVVLGDGVGGGVGIGRVCTQGGARQAGADHSGVVAVELCTGELLGQGHVGVGDGLGGGILGDGDFVGDHIAHGGGHALHIVLASNFGDYLFYRGQLLGAEGQVGVNVAVAAASGPAHGAVIALVDFCFQLGLHGGGPGSADSGMAFDCTGGIGSQGGYIIHGIDVIVIAGRVCGGHIGQGIAVVRIAIEIHAEGIYKVQIDCLALNGRVFLGDGGAVVGDDVCDCGVGDFGNVEIAGAGGAAIGGHHSDRDGVGLTVHGVIHLTLTRGHAGDGAVLVHGGNAGAAAAPGAAGCDVSAQVQVITDAHRDGQLAHGTARVVAGAAQEHAIFCRGVNGIRVIQHCDQIGCAAHRGAGGASGNTGEGDGGGGGCLHDLRIHGVQVAGIGRGGAYRPGAAAADDIAAGGIEAVAGAVGPGAAGGGGGKGIGLDNGTTGCQHQIIAIALDGVGAVGLGHCPHGCLGDIGGVREGAVASQHQIVAAAIRDHTGAGAANADHTAQGIGGAGLDALPADGCSGNGCVEVRAGIGAGIVAALVRDGVGFTHIEGHSNGLCRCCGTFLCRGLGCVLFLLLANGGTGGDGGDGQVCIGDGGTCAFIQKADAAILQLGQAGIGVGAAGGGDGVGVSPADGAVVLHQTHKDLAVGPAGGVAGGREEDGGLAVDLLGVHNGREFTAGVVADAADGLFAAPGGAIVGGHIVAAVAGEHIQAAVCLHDGGLGGLRTHICGTGPGFATVIGVDHAGVSIAAVAVGIAGKDNAPGGGHNGIAGANPIEIVAAVFDLGIEHGGCAPGLSAVRGGGQIEIACFQHLIGAVAIEQVAGQAAVIIQIEILVHSIAGNGNVGGIAVNIGIAIITEVAQIVIIGGAAGAADGAELQVTVLIIPGAGVHIADVGAAGIEVHQHPDGFAICGKGGVNKGSGAGIVAVAIVAQIVGKGVVPGAAAVCGVGHNGVQPVAVIGGVPPGVTGCHKGAVIQGHNGRNTEIAAAAGAAGEGLRSGSTVRGLGAGGGVIDLQTVFRKDFHGGLILLLGGGGRQNLGRGRGEQHRQAEQESKTSFELEHDLFLLWGIIN